MGDGEINSFSCIVIQTVFDEDTATVRHDTWKAGYEAVTVETAAQLADILSSSRYRPMLKTLWQPNTFEPDGYYHAYLILVMSDGSTQMVDYMGNNLVLLRSSPLNLILRPTDKEVCTRLAEFVIEIGQKI